MLLLGTGPKSALPMWRELFRERVPGLEVGWIDDAGVDPAAVDYALVWSPPAGRLAQFPNLKCIISSGAGVDRILADPLLPGHVPIVRMHSPRVERRMAEYLLMSLLSMSRDLPKVIGNHQARKWEVLDPAFSLADVTVGILGLGNLGAFCAAYLARAGCKVTGWSRSRKDIEHVRCHAGEAELGRFLSDCDILVCMLPLTEETRGILCAGTFAQLPDGARLVNVARGAHLVEADLLEAMRTGKIRAAVLDVFEEEPLPASSPLWRTPGILVTSHIAANAPAQDKADFAARVIEACEAGLPPPNVYLG